MPTNSSLRNIYDVLQRKGNTTVANTSYEYFADRMKYDDYAHTIYNALKADNPNTVKADYQRFKNIFADEAVGTKRGRTYNAPSNPNGGTRKDYLNEAGQSKPTSNTPAASTTPTSNTPAASTTPTSNTPAASTTPTSNTPAASTFNYATGEYETPIPENASPLVRALATNNFGNQNAKLKDPTNVVRSYVEENEKIAKDAVHNLTAPSRTLVRPDLPYISNTVQGAIDTFNDRLNESIGNVLSDNSIQQAIAGIVKKREDEPNSIPSQAILGMGSNPIYSSAMTAMNTQHFNDANRIAANIQNDINNTTPSLLSSPDVKAKIQAACKQLGVSEEDYTSILAQAISQQATYTFDNHLVEDEMPKSTLDYIVRGVTDSIGGKIFFGMDKRRNYARAMANQMTEEGHNPNFNGEKPGWVTRAARGAVGLVADAPLFGGMGTTANLSVRGASAVGRRLLSRSGAKWLTELSAEEFARKYATMTMAQKVGANFVRGVPTSALIGAQYGFANNFVTEATTTEDTSLGDLFLNSLKAGAGEAAVFGAIGVTGSFMRPLAQRVGITGAELTRGKQMLHGAERVGMEGLSLGVEAGTMSLAGAAVHGDDVNSQSVFENAVTILLMRLTNGHNIKNARQSLYNLTHSSEGFNTYIYGQDGKLNKYNIRLTETEAAELRNSQAGRDFIRVTTEKGNGEQHVDAQANAYRAFVDDPNISLATKMKINAAFGVTNTSVPLSHHDAIDRTNKQVLDFSQDGTLLSRTPYRNASEARAIREQHSLMRSNWRMLNTFGLAVQSHSAITRPDGQMSPIAVAFLQQYGYNADKAPTDANNAKLMADLANPQSTLYKNYTKFARGFFFDEVLPEYEGQRTEIETALRKNPLSRTAKETQLLNDVMRKVKDYVAPKGKPHEKMSYADGEDKANEAGLGTANPQKQPVAEMSEEMADAMTRWQETLNTNDVIREEYNRMHKEGTSDVDIYYNLIERSGVTQEEAAPLADYINAQAKLQGMAEATQQAIETNTQLHVSQWSFKGTINGETRNGDTGLYVRDNQGRTLIVGNGIVAFDSNGRAKDECANNLLVCLDTATNQMVNVNAKDVSLVGEKSAEEFANDYRQRLTNANADVAEILNAAASVSPESTTTEKPEATAEKPEATTSPTEEKQAETAETPQATTDHATTDGQVNTEESLSPLARVPKDKNGKYDFEQVDADTAWDAIVELAQKGGSDVETATRSAKNIADQMVVKKTAELKKARSAKLRSADDVEGMIAAEAEKAARIEKAEKSLAHWKEISSTLLRRKTAEDNRKRDEEAAKAVEKNAATTEVSLEGVPDWTQDRPADARQRGYRRVNGHAVMRQSPVKTIEGKETEVKFADDVFQKGHIALVEADDLQPSHQNRQPNASHFLPEAQPKKRTDIDSVAAADKMAAHIRPSEVVSTVIAFSGAPTVNARGEAIQGNNRSAGLKTMWESHKDQADIYRNYLIEHAEEFGLTPEAIKSMKRPVLVNMVDVPDERAITLGQYDAKDIESGGTERIKPQNAVQKMGTNMRTFANLLLRTADEDASFSQLVDKNAESVLKWMQQQGYITPTQFKSAFDSKGALTAGAANDLKGILYQSIFQGANEHLEEMFNRMPAKAQRAILATAFRDYDSPESERMNTELQNSIMAFNELMQDPDFAKATNFGEARKAIMAWARQYQFDDATGEPYLPNEKFSNFALHLAAMYKGEPQSLIQNTLNKIFDLVQGKQEADLFSQDTVDNTPRTLTEAIKEVLNIDYNGQTRSNVLGSNSPTSQEGQPGSTEPTTSGERNTQGTSNAERSPGTGGVREATAGGRRTTEGEEVDENGHAFVKSNDGSTVFGEIRETSGLAAAPIKLSEGYQDADGKGYGLAHIEANHGKQIHKAGFNSVADFVSFVAQNYDEDNIRVGKKRINGNATYLIQVTDEHDNTLFVELSRDGSYWNVNSGGVFRKGYADKKETVAKTEPQQPNNAVSSGSSLSADGQKDGITSTEPNGKPTVSAGKVSEKSKTKQEKTEENAAKSKTSQWRKTTYRGNQGEYEITVEANKVRFADLNEGDVFIDKEGGLTTLTKKLGNNEYLVSNQGRSFIISAEEGRSWSEWLQTNPKVDRVVPFDVVRRAEAETAKPREQKKNENNTPREDTEPKPIGRGAFGDIYDQFKGKVKEAFDFLTKHKSGDLLGVFHREDTGDIDLVWGDENGGLSHIISKHVGEGKDFATVDDAMQRIDKVLREGKLIQDGALRYVVSEDGYRVAIRKDYNGKKKNWVVTAIDYNRSKEEKGITTNPTSASHGANGSELAVPSNSAGKDTKVSDTKQTSGEKIDDYGEKIAGARKDMLRDYAKTLENANVESFVALPLAKAFKRPNLKKLVEVGALREKDARFAEAVLANHLSQGKPRLLTRSRYAGIENTVDIRNWAERCAEGADMLRTLFGMDEAERDKFIEEVRQRKAYDEEAVNKRKSQLAEWNPGQKFEGTCYGINPVALFMDVYSQLGYDGIGDVKLPIVDVKPDSTFDSYELTAANGKGFYSSRPLQSYEDVVDEIVYQTKRRNGDSDNDHPTSVFRVIHGDPIEEVNDYYVSTFPSLRSTSPTIKYFNTKEEADAYANAYMEAHEKGSAFVKEHLRVVGYKEFTIAYRCGEGVANEKAARYDTTMTYATPEEARAAIVERHDELNDFANAKDAEAFTKSGEGRQKKDYVYIHSYTSDGGKTWTYAIVLDDKYNPHKSVWNTIPYALADGFKTRKEAEKYLEDHRAEWDEKIADINRQRRAFVYFDGDAKARVGEDYRKGEDVTAEQFATQFGFRGVQFGNWTNQNDRQAAINNAFDGFMDLAKLLGVSPRALSLNGELGIAFGARGTGKASAHYELQEVVINLTKTKGAGSLAHEWWHALDNYFARQGGVALGVVTNSKGITMRDELRKAFNTLIDHTANSDYDKRSAEYGKSYWGARHEETARMFETWVNNELLRRGERNHFLVGKNPNAENDIAEINYFFYKWSLENSIHEPMSFEEFKKTPMALSGYVYPSRAELETFGKDLRRIFDTVQERVDEETGNVVMYHRGNVVTNTTSQEQALLNAVVEQVRKAGIEVVTDVAEGQRVLDMANGNNANVRTQAMTDKLTKAASTIKGWLQKGSRGKSFTIELPTATQRMVRNAMGRDFDSHNITANGIAHALKNHGENGNKIGENSIPLRNEDMELIPYIMTAPDYVREGSSDATGRKSVRFYKDLSNGYVVVVEKEYKNSPDDMETITMWAEKSSSEATNARRNAPDTHVQNATLSTEDAAKIRKDAETAIANDRNLREQRVYHGSGADFDHFDHSHMGEGEGAQAYGWGTYVTEVEGIGRSYAKAVRNKGVTVQVRENGIWREIDKSSSDYSISQEAAQLIGDYGNYKEAVRFADRWRETANTEEIRNHWQAVYDFLKAHKSKDIKVKEDHYLYTVEIPDEGRADYLDYYSPLSEQSQDRIDDIDNALTASGWHRSEVTAFGGNYLRFAKDGKKIEFSPKTTGHELYDELTRAFGSDKAASKFLSEAGFTGIKYPAQARSGGRTDGAKNYVIFNEADAKITDHVRFFKTPNGEAYGYTVGGKIYIDPRIATAETPVHEYAHLWAEALRSGNAKEWKNVVALMRGTSVWDEVKKRYPELETDSDIADEVIAQYSGRRGAERLREEQRKIAEGKGSVAEKSAAIRAIESVKQALKKFWQGVCDFLHIHYTSAEEVADRVMKDLLDGVNPNDFIKGKASDRVRKQFIGEKGAREADHAEEVTTRLDNLDVARQMEEAKKEAKASGIQQYRELSGEVESRNVQSRMGMTAEERRQSLASETEDVSREDQIFLFDEDGTNASMAEQRPKEQRLQKLRESKPIEITGREVKPSEDLKEYKKNALEYGKGLQGTYTNKDTGMTVKLQRGRHNGGVNEVLQHDYKDIPHLQSVAAIPQIIENGIYIDSRQNADKAKNPNVSEYQYYVCGLKIGGEDYTVRSTIAVDTKGNRYYDHKLTSIEKGKLLDIIDEAASQGGNGFGTTPDTKSTTNSAGKDKVLMSILQTKGAKSDDVSTTPQPNTAVIKHIEGVSKKIGAKVNVVNSIDEVNNAYVSDQIKRGRNITGWYDETTDEVYLYMPNIHDRYTAEKTIWHETVGHKGLRALLKDQFRPFLRSLWLDKTSKIYDDLHKYVRENLHKNNFDLYDTIEEYLAKTAESGKGEQGFWPNVRQRLNAALHGIGYRLSPNASDARYMLWLSKNIQKHAGDTTWEMRAARARWNIENDTPETSVSNGVFGNHSGDMASWTKTEFDDATDGRIHLRTSPTTATAIDRYNKALAAHGYMASEAYLDNMISLKKLMEAALPKTKIEDIPASENPYLLKTPTDAAIGESRQRFEHDIMAPLETTTAKCLDAFSGNTTERLREFNLYLIKKSGAERNRVLFVRDHINSLRENDRTSADSLQTAWNAKKKQLGDRLRNGNIALDGYYQELDDYIRQNVDPNYQPGEHDYSGIHGVYNITDSKAPYDDSRLLSEIMDTEARIGKENVDTLWKQMRTATIYAVDTDYKAGINDKATHDHVADMFDWYVPMRGSEAPVAEEVYGYITKNGLVHTSIGAAIKQAKGHTELSDTNVIAQIGAMGNSAIARYGDMVIKQAFARFVRNHKGELDGLVTEMQIWEEKVGVDNQGKDIWQEVQPQIPEKATPDEVAKIVSDFESDMQSKKIGGTARVQTSKGNVPYKFANEQDRSQHIIDVMIAGRKHRFVINSNPRAAQALNGLLENKTLSKTFAAIQRFQAQTYTSWSPEFVQRNAMRDASFALTNILIKENPVYVARALSYYLAVNPFYGFAALRPSQLSGRENNGLGLYGLYRRGKLNPYIKIHRYFKEFMENGGTTGWVQILSMDEWTKKYKVDIKAERNPIKVGQFLRSFILGNVEHLNEAIENWARFAVYCASRDSGRGVTRSAYDAKEVSTNFNRHGSGNAISSFVRPNMGKGAETRRGFYSATSAYLRNFSVFFNAGAQSTNLLLKNIKNHPGRTAFWMIGLNFALGALIPVINNCLIAVEDEDERNGVADPYGELPDYIRRNNLCIYKGQGDFFTYPLAIENRAFYGLGDLAAGLLYRPEIAGQKTPWLDAVGCLSQLLPGQDYLNGGEIDKAPATAIVKAYVPTPTSPLVEWLMNSDWKGSPIERRSDFLENDPAWKKSYGNTLPIFIDLNKWVNAQTNTVDHGNPEMKGNETLDALTNPSMLETLFGGYLGGTYTFARRAYNAATTDADLIPGEIPFLRTVHYTPSERSAMMRTRTKWYNYKEQYDVTQRNVQKLKSRNVPWDERIGNIAAYQRFTNSRDFEALRIIQLADKQIQRIKKVSKLNNDPEAVQLLQQQTDLIMQDAVRKLDALQAE